MSHDTKRARGSDDLLSLRGLIEDAPLLAEAIVDTIRESVLLLDGSLTVVLANRSFYKTFAVEPAETLGRLVYDLGNGQWNVPELRQLLEQILPQNSSFRDLEVSHTFPSIGRKVMMLDAERLRRRDDQTELILLAIDDVTALREMEERDRYAAVMFRSSGEALVGLSAHGIIRSWNPAAERLFGYRAEEAIGHSATMLTPSGFHAEEQDFLRCLRAGTSCSIETVRLTKDGRRVTVILTAAPVFDGDDTLIGISAAVTDISERKQMEEALRDREQALAQLVREKEVLVKEVHHRVKNNLQTIASLLSLHAGHTDNASVVDALGEAEGRVQAIARLHERLYASADLARIHFGDYLSNLSKELESLHGRPKVTSHVVSDDIVLDMERATPLGLIANELIVNCFKHAFPLDRSGHIKVSFEYVRESVPISEPLDNGRVRLRVKDEGIGFPPGVKVENLRSMGLEIVRLLSQQLNAHCEFNGVNGVECTVTFPLGSVP